MSSHSRSKSSNLHGKFKLVSNVFNILFLTLLTRLLVNNCMSDDSAYDVGIIHHIVRRAIEETQYNVTYSCNTSALPQPSSEYPAILFKDVNYNNCSRDGFYIKLRAGQYRTFCKNDNEKRKRTLRFASMLILPGMNVTFRTCCPSGNEWSKTISDFGSTPDLNRSVYYHSELGDNRGIRYTIWLHWQMSFYLRVDKGQNDNINTSSCGNCFFGKCGLTGNCECAPGYSGIECETRPTNETYPTQDYPLVLFTETNYGGSYVRVKPEEFKVFATNRRFSRQTLYNSMRMMYNRTIIFARNTVFTVALYDGSDIEDIPEFMVANPGTANSIWYNYDASHEADFLVKVHGNARCDNCSTTGGVCYTGSCLCLPTYTGGNCNLTTI